MYRLVEPLWPTSNRFSPHGNGMLAFCCRCCVDTCYNVGDAIGTEHFSVLFNHTLGQQKSLQHSTFFLFLRLPYHQVPFVLSPTPFALVRSMYLSPSMRSCQVLEDEMFSWAIQ